MIGKQPPNWAERSRIMHRVCGSVDMMIRGIGDVEAWKDICDAINCVEALCDMGKLKAAEHMPAVDLAKAGMVASRGLAPGSMTMAPEQLQALRDIEQAYDAALGRLSYGTLAEARTRVVMAISAQRKEAGAVVVD